MGLDGEVLDDGLLGEDDRSVTSSSGVRALSSAMSVPLTTVASYLVVGAQRVLLGDVGGLGDAVLVAGGASSAGLTLGACCDFVAKEQARSFM